MKHPKIRPMLATTGVLALLAAGTSIASARPAADGVGSQPAAGTAAAGPGDGRRGPGGRHGAGPPFFKAAASYLGLTPKVLLKRLQPRTATLAKVAEAEGASLDGLQAAIIADAEAHAAAAVAAGRHTQAEGGERVAQLRDDIGELVTDPMRTRRGNPGLCPPKPPTTHTPPPTTAVA